MCVGKTPYEYDETYKTILKENKCKIFPLWRYTYQFLIQKIVTAQKHSCIYGKYIWVKLFFSQTLENILFKLYNCLLNTHTYLNTKTCCPRVHYFYLTCTVLKRVNNTMPLITLLKLQLIWRTRRRLHTEEWIHARGIAWRRW